jgi:hypothetical protein
MIENHCGHVNTRKQGDRVLIAIGGWDAMHGNMGRSRCLGIHLIDSDF